MSMHMIPDKMHFDTIVLRPNNAIWNVDGYNIRSVYLWGVDGIIQPRFCTYDDIGSAASIKLRIPSTLFLALWKLITSTLNGRDVLFGGLVCVMGDEHEIGGPGLADELKVVSRAENELLLSTTNQT